MERALIEKAAEGYSSYSLAQSGFIDGAEWMNNKAIEAYKHHCRFFKDGICYASNENYKCKLRCNLGEYFLNELNK